MRKSLIIVGAIIGVALLARRLASQSGVFNWEKVLERMPEDAPPKWMFANITAIRENTERILERLDEELAVTSGHGVSQDANP